MPTTRVERTIQSIISLKHQWINPLDRMRSSAVGLYPLPVELWEEIFAIATDADTYWAEVDGSWCTISNPFFTAKEEDLLRDPTARDNRRLLRTRHSIILVCKSWYSMGIPILWSHLQFDEKGPRNVATMIYSALKRNPALAAHVLRVTIKSVIFDEYNHIEPQSLDAVVKFVRLLTNVEAISCSLPYAAHLDPRIPPGIVMLSSKDLYFSCSIPMIIGLVNNVKFRDTFWTHCRTLSLTFETYCGGRDAEYDGRKITLNNLIDFRLDIRCTASLQWIQCWNFPILKNFHIINAPSKDYIYLIQRVHLTLEKLQIYLKRDDYRWISQFTLPNLKEIYLTGQCIDTSDMIIFCNAINTPNLHRLVISWEPHPTFPSIFGVIAENLRRYPSLEELVIMAPNAEWVHSSAKPNRFILQLEHVSDWCEKGVAVEIITGKNAERRIYAKESFPMDELDALLDSHTHLF